VHGGEYRTFGHHNDSALMAGYPDIYFPSRVYSVDYLFFIRRIEIVWVFECPYI